jgi:tripartite-type tricarboxylate transporter receptor subunit TctC
MHRRQLLGLAVAAGATAGGGAAAGAWPERPIRIIVPFPPASGVDTTARLIADPLRDRLGQPVLVESRSGAGGNVGAAAVARAASDGHTLLISSPGPIAANQFVYRGMPYDTNTAFAPIIVLGHNPMVIMTSNARPERDFAALAASVRAAAAPLRYGTAGAGGGGHLTMELLRSQQGLVLEHVPFRGGAQGLVALAAGQIEFAIDAISASWPQISSGVVRPIAVTGTTRWPFLPDVPTVAERGAPGFSMTAWTVLAFPAGTPGEIVVRMNAAVNDVIADPEIRQKLLERGTLVAGGTPGEAEVFLREERGRWARAVEVSGATAD